MSIPTRDEATEKMIDLVEVARWLRSRETTAKVVSTLLDTISFDELREKALEWERFTRPPDPDVRGLADVVDE